MTNSHSPSSAASEHETRRNPEMEKFVQITPVVMEGYPNACNVWLKVENQKFMVSPHSCETRDEGEWLRDMLCIALARVVADSIPALAQPTREGKSPEWFCQWLKGYLGGIPGRDELDAFEANSIRNTLNEVLAAQPPAAPVETKCDCLPWPDKCPYCGGDAPVRRLSAGSASALAAMSDPTHVYRRISVTDLDPGDGTAHPNFEEVLAKGFYAMGWAQPTLAAYEMIYAAAERIASDISRELETIPAEPQGAGK